MKNELLDILKCCSCGSQLIQKEEMLICDGCNSVYEIRGSIPIMLSGRHSANPYGMDYIEHYKVDAEIFDYFEERDFPATEHDEKRLRQYIVSFITDRNSIILDVGSGGAWAAKELVKDSKLFVSFDVSQINVETALNKYSSENHSGVVGDALQPAFRENTFDYIIASEIIEHIVTPDDFVNKLIPLLKPGGKLIISTPYKETLHFSQCIHCNQMTPKNAHLHSFDEHKLMKLAKKDIVSKTKYYIFGNKALVMLRTHVILKYFPLSLWKIFDSIVNKIIRKQSHIIIIFERK